MTNSSTTLEAFGYLGLGTVEARTHPQSGVDLRYLGSGTGEAVDR